MNLKLTGAGLFLLFLCAGCSSQTQLVVQEEVSTATPLASPVPAESGTPSPTPNVGVTATPKPTPRPTSSSKPINARVLISSLPSTYRSDEPREVSAIDTIVIHSLYNPYAQDPFSIQSAKAVLDESEVSSHFVIDRTGKIFQLVPENYQAWHAGASTMPAPDNRSGVNAFSLGIELIGNETSGFTQTQYDSVAKLVADLIEKFSLTKIVGHSDIAPGRKTDPWKFDWKKFESLVKNQTTRSFTVLGSH